MSGETLESAPTAAGAIDLLVVSGHGSNGEVWGDASGKDAELNLARAFANFESSLRSGRLKCLIVPTCNNLDINTAAVWVPLFNHTEPVHLLLGYELSYSGGAIGAQVMTRFVEELANDRSIPLVEAWRRANEGVKKPQPWAAFATAQAAKLNVEDWIRGQLPTPKKTTKLIHFNAEHPSGVEAKLLDPNYMIRWVMEDGTIIDKDNNQPGKTEIGLFPGKRGKILIRAQSPGKIMSKGDEFFLFIYRYRLDKKIDVFKLLKFDDDLLTPKLSGESPLLTPEQGRAAFRGDITGFRVVPDKTVSELELGFTVLPTAVDHFKKDGPGGSFGRFLLHFVHEFTLQKHQNESRMIVSAPLERHAYPAVAGALLRG